MLLLFTPGCSQVNQLNERLIVNGIGVDIEDGAYVVTMHVFDAQRASAGGEESQDIVVVTGRGRSVIDAFNAITLQSGKEPLLSQNLVLIVGEDTAKSGMNNVIDFFIRYYETRPTVELFVAKERTAREVMNCNSDGRLISAKDIENLADSGEINAEQVHSDVLTLVNRLQDESSDGFMIALTMSGNEEEGIVYVDGTGVLKGDRLVGYLTLEETQGYLLMTGEARSGTLVVPVEGVGNVSFSLIGGDSSIDAKVENDLPVFDVSIRADLDLYEIDGNIHQKYGLDMVEKMEEAANQAIYDRCVQTTEKLLREYQSDIFRFGRRMLQSQPEYFKSRVQEWTSVYAQSTVNITVESDVRQEGQEINPL
ncbi:germination protein, Ger(x)C family [[Clostridium] leptum DSM 753]|nr:germination protein, Ger(x)C family [[Clostridium] leptum DSM 753]